LHLCSDFALVFRTAGGGSYFLPGIQAMDIVRRAFKHNDIHPSDPGKSPEESMSRSIDVALACIRVLERNLAKV